MMTRRLLLITLGFVVMAASLAAMVPDSPALSPPTVVVPPADDGTAPAPPAPTLSLRGGTRRTRMALESFFRRRADGPGYSGAVMSPPTGSRLPRFRAAWGQKVVLNSELDAKRVEVELLTRSTGRTQRLRSRRLDDRHWEFTMPKPKGRILRVRIGYSDGGNSRSLAALSNPPVVRCSQSGRS